MRTIVDIPEHELKRLDDLARQRKVSRAELVRRAVGAYTQQHHQPADVFGLWRDQPVDGVEYQRRLRREWEREWDR